MVAQRKENTIHLGGMRDIAEEVPFNWVLNNEYKFAWGKKRDDIPGCPKARRYKIIWLHSNKGKNFKGAGIRDAWWEQTGKNTR